MSPNATIFYVTCNGMCGSSTAQTLASILHVKGGVFVGYKDRILGSGESWEEGIGPLRGTWKKVGDDPATNSRSFPYQQSDDPKEKYPTAVKIPAIHDEDSEFYYKWIRSAMAGKAVPYEGWIWLDKRFPGYSEGTLGWNPNTGSYWDPDYYECPSVDQILKGK
jgi:hypothetical protein